MKKTLVAVSLTGLLASGCKNVPSLASMAAEEPDIAAADSTPSAQTDGDDIAAELMGEEPLSVAVDELFDDFIFNFASNQQLQFERTLFPLTVHSGTRQDTICRDEWHMERFFMNDGEYTLIFDSREQMEKMNDTALDEAMVEKIFLDNKFIRQYVFRRHEGKWMLCEMRNQTLPRNPNASFIDFYHHFVTDTLFQRESLSEEIEFVGPDPDNDFAQMEGVITPDSWDAFAPELPLRMLFNVVYGRQDSTANEKIFVLRGIANGQELELTFRRDNDRWMLTKLLE